jgi:hypothetical protein
MPNKDDKFKEIITILGQAAKAVSTSQPASEAISNMSASIQQLHRAYTSIIENNQRLAMLTPENYTITEETLKKRQALFDAYFTACHGINKSLRQMHETGTQFQDHNWGLRDKVGLDFQAIYELKGWVKAELDQLQIQEERLYQAIHNATAPDIVAPASLALAQHVEVNGLLEDIHHEVSQSIASSPTTPAAVFLPLDVEDAADKIFYSPTSVAIQTAQELVAATRTPKSTSISSMEMNPPEPDAPLNKSWLDHLAELLLKLVSKVVNALKSVLGSNPTSNFKEELRRSSKSDDEDSALLSPPPTPMS